MTTHEQDNVEKQENNEYLRGMARWYLAITTSPKLLRDRYYCIDSDVATMFHSPAQSAHYVGLRYHGSIDQNAEISTAAKALASELSRFILYEHNGICINQDDPRPVLPGISREILSKLNTLYMSFEEATDKIDEQIVALEEELKSNAIQVNNALDLDDKHSLSDALHSFADKWLKGNYFQLAESLGRVADLLGSSVSDEPRLLHIDRCKFKLSSTNPNKTYLPNLLHDKELRGELKKQYQIFCDELNVSKGVADKVLGHIENDAPINQGYSKQERNASDAHDLAYIEVVNRYQKGLAANAEDEFLCLISGSPTLKNVTKVLEKKHLIEKIDIIHPLDLLPALIYQVKDEAHVELAQLKDMLFGILRPIWRSNRHTIQGRANFDFDLWLDEVATGDRTIRSAEIFSETELQNILTAWESLSLTISAASKNKEWTLTQKLKTVLVGVDELDEEKWFENIKELFDSSKREVIEKLASVQPAVHSKTEDLVMRNIPPMRLEKFENTRKVADKILTHDLDRSEINRHLEKIKREDETGYLELLLRGLIESKYQNVAFSRIIFWAAFEKANDLYEDNHDVITGRDAAYALAVSMRLSAQKATFYEDMKRNRKYMDIARARHGEKHDNEDFRFIAEDLAYELTKCWASHLNLEDENNPITNDHIRSIFDQCVENLEKVSELDKDDEIPVIKHYVQRRLCSIAIQSWLLIKYAYVQKKLYQELRPQVERYQEKLDFVMKVLLDKKVYIETSATSLMRILYLICIKEGLIKKKCNLENYQEIIKACEGEGDGDGNGNGVKISQFDLIDKYRAPFLSAILKYHKSKSNHLS